MDDLVSEWIAAALATAAVALDTAWHASIVSDLSNGRP